MLAVASDLHFTDGTTGPHNVNPDAWDIFFGSIGRKREGSGDGLGLTVVVAGDFFDLLRSTVWLKSGARPWLSGGRRSAALLVLRGILRANRESIGRLREHLRDSGARLVYVLGNHDRLVGEIPELRAEIVGALGPVDFVRGEYRDAGHGAAVVHGHASDPYNHEARGKAPIGDAIVIELFNRFPLEVARVFPTDAGLQAAVAEIDNVRPLTEVPAWLLWSTRGRAARVVKELKAVWNRLVVEFLELDFVRGWMSRHNSRLRLFDDADRLAMVLKGSRLIGFKVMAGLGGRLGGLAGAIESGAGGFGGGSTYLVAGHTHCAVTEALGGGRIYFNTGTWRKTCVRSRDGGFTAWKAMGYTMIYGPGARHRFATWRGELQ